jgi:hypothetical protein
MENFRRAAKKKFKISEPVRPCDNIPNARFKTTVTFD